MSPRIRHRSIAPIAAVLALAACGGGGDGGGTGPRGATGVATVRFLEDGLRTDTARAGASDTFVVQVHDSSGHPAAGVVVRLSLDAPSGSDAALVRAGTATGALRFDTTDAAGEVRTQLLPGRVAGTIFVVARAGSVSDSAAFHVVPGAPTSLVLATHDTTLMIGRPLAVGVVVRDASGNVRTDGIAYSDPAGLVDASAADVRGLAAGTTWVRISAGALRDSVHLLVVPAGRFVASTNDGHADVELVSSDGTGRRLLVDNQFGQTFTDLQPVWSPDGATVLYHTGGQNSHLVRTDTLGNHATFVTETLGFEGKQWPRYSRDGAWVYFVGLRSLEGATPGQEIWRVHADGSGAERVGSGTGANEYDLYPSPSPDGTRLLLSSNRGRRSGEGYGLRIRNLATGADDSLGITGYDARWSPTGTQIAWFTASQYGSAIMVANPDGTGARQVSPAGVLYGIGLDWSPDGRWIVAARWNAAQSLGFDVIDVQTGTVLHLPNTAGLQSPSWRP